MEQARKNNYSNILGDTKETIEAIQRFIDKSSKIQQKSVNDNKETPLDRVIKSVLNDDIQNELEKIIKNL